MVRFGLAFAALLFTGMSAGQAPESPGKLPIEVPHDASLNFEADTAGKDILPLLKQLMAAGVIDAGGHPDEIDLKMGSVSVVLKPQDVATLMRPVREIHVVTFSLAKNAPDPVHRYEETFKAEGMSRVANENGMLLMRRPGDRYAAVYRQHDNVTVVRIDGMPNLGVATNIILRSLAASATQAKKGSH